MPLNKLENFLKNAEGRIIYVSPADLDSTDSILNQGNSPTQPFKTVQRALLEAARFSYQKGRDNDLIEKTTILLHPGEHIIDNRPGFSIDNTNGVVLKKPNGDEVDVSGTLNLSLESNFDLTQEDNLLYKFNSIHGGVIVPRGTSIVGYDLRKTKIRPKYVPNPTDDSVPYSSIFRITGTCYFWQFSIFDGDESGTVYTDNTNFLSSSNRVTPRFSHHKLTVFEYADGVNEHANTGMTDLDMYYAKVSTAYREASNREIDDKFPTSGLDKQRAEWEIVGAFAGDPIFIQSIQAGTNAGEPTNKVTVRTKTNHNLNVGTPIKVDDVSETRFNIGAKVVSVVDDRTFVYTLPDISGDMNEIPTITGREKVVIEVDTVSGASPYIFNISMRSVWGMNGLHADGSKASGFRSMVVAQFTGVSLQKDDRAFVKYNKSNRTYEGILLNEVQTGKNLAQGSSETNSNKVYHLDSDAIYRNDWQSTHVKITNNAVLQIVSVFAIGYAKHFYADSGGDASITNSNSNFGQLALVSEGFRKDAFEKDDRAYLTHIISPKAITEEEEDIDWLTIDVDATQNGADDKIFLQGFNSRSIVPPEITQGFRIGARKSDKLYVNLPESTSNPNNLVTKSANILMDHEGGGIEGITNIKEWGVNSPSSNGQFLLKDGITNHHFATGEKILLISDDGDLPEGIVENQYYYVILLGTSTNTFKLAASVSDAESGIAITNITGGTNLRILSRVSDKKAGDVGHPINWSGSQWYIQVHGTTNDIKTHLNTFADDSIFDGGATEPSYIKRISDPRSLDDKIFKFRIVVPKETENGKDPVNGFIIQESSSTSVERDNEFSRGDSADDALNYSGTSEPLITTKESNVFFQRNPKFISGCTATADGANTTVKIETELPHNLRSNELVTIKNIRNSTNTDGKIDKGFNGSYEVTVVDNKTFTYSVTGTLSNPTTDFHINKTNVGSASTVPVIERTDLKSNFYIYRSEVISNYVADELDSIIHSYPLKANYSVPNHFTGSKYSQNVINLYPQLDRDNPNDSPRASKSFALRSPLGKVITNDLKKSLTRETTDEFLEAFGVGLKIDSSTDSTGARITLEGNHGLSGILNFTPQGTPNNVVGGTFIRENVKILNAQQNINTWTGGLADVSVDGNAVTVNVVDPGYVDVDDTVFLDETDLLSIVDAGGDKLESATSNVATTALSGNRSNLVVQLGGSTLYDDRYYRLKSIEDSNTFDVHRPSDDNTNLNVYSYAYIVGRSVQPTSVSTSNKVTTFTTDDDNPHGLVKGNKFQLNDSNNAILGTYIVSEKVNYKQFKAVTGDDTISGTVYILKHGLSAADGESGKSNENLSVRGTTIFDREVSQLNASITASATEIVLKTLNSQTNIGKRFKIGSFIKIDEEIIRIADNADPDNDTSATFKVIRGVLGTRSESHDQYSLVEKIKPIPIQFNRPSILRASGHTFEYLGYGPGNYSTALPQVQVKTISEREEFLAQAQEKAAGAVVYTGMNDKGDFYIGNQKKSSLTGEETTFDTPIPTITGEDPSKLSVVFDEVTVKDRIVVEGGKSKFSLSQFDGPLNLNGDVRFGKESKVRIKSNVESGSTTSGALTVIGGVGIGGDLNVGGDLDVNGRTELDITNISETLNVTGIATFANNIDANGDLDVDGHTELDNVKVSAASTFDGLVDINAGGQANTFKVEDLTDNHVVIAGADGELEDDSNLTFDGSTLSVGVDLNVNGRSTFGNTVTVSSGGANITGATTFANAVTVSSGGLTVSSDGATITTGGLTVSAGGANITGDVTANDNLTVTGALDVNDGATLNKATIENLNNDQGVVFTNSSGQLSNSPNLKFDGNDLSVHRDIIAFASDERLKTNISPITEALSKVKSIDGFTYNFNDTAKELGFDTKIDYAGVSAQKVQKVLPEVVRPAPSNNNYITVQYEKLVPLLIEAIKELSDKVDSLEERLNN